MTTEEIGDALALTAKLMELHEENAQKVKTLTNTAYRLHKTNPDFSGMSLEDIQKIDGMGKGVSAKIFELMQTGSTKELNLLLEKTPEGVIEMMSIKGIGPKKVRQLWKELEIESIGELLYACNENRLIDLKGFGTKTQDGVKANIEFKFANANKAHYGRIIKDVEKLVSKLKTELETIYVSLTGEIYRKCEVIDKVEILIGSEKRPDENQYVNEIKVPVQFIYCNAKDFYYELVKTSSAEKHFTELNLISSADKVCTTEKEVYTHADIQFTEPELREGLFEIEKAKNNSLPKLIEFTDLKGSLHNHSKYSDGVHSLEDMALKCKELGYEYFGIADHSQSAFYADGLHPEKVLQQQIEIDKLNRKLAPFKIFKGIESDILNNGNLDYEEDILKTFDYVVASVHSNLKMDEEKATARLLKAIENPYTTILGHPTGRLLLSRPGYPINYKKIIDACAANGVIMEL
ncbi:MAG: DNA polymerase/3'-5' exonuclease PolX, partial [Bacteroidia bacterium]|nr:DNA polymerase/3'-5' exonuclease PolX [Bacteroidia bacterium]